MFGTSWRISVVVTVLTRHYFCVGRVTLKLISFKYICTQDITSSNLLFHFGKITHKYNEERDEKGVKQHL